MKIKLYLLFYILYSCLPSVTVGQNIKDTTDISKKTFRLGEVVVIKTRDEDYVSADDIEKNNSKNVATAIKILPSVVFSRSGSRFESTVFIRGFDIRSVPVFIDGIPVYVPYDGNIDLGMLTTYNVSKIDVSKGYSSMMYGSNTAGGAINIISSKPGKNSDLKARAGVMSGNGYEAAASIGSNFGKGYIQADFSVINRDYIPLSAKFDTVSLQTDYALNNSFYSNIKTGFKAAFTPDNADEYSISYFYTHGTKGNPVYLGNDPDTRVRYWQWPYWDKQSIYFISGTSIARNIILNTRIYYDMFKNKLSSFDDESYTTQEMRYAFNSFYDDYTLGGNAELSIETGDENTLKMSVHIKNDHHREHNDDSPCTNVADNTFSAGFEDVFMPGSGITIIPGISYDLRKSLIAETYDPFKDSIYTFPDNSNDALNAQIAFYYKFSDKMILDFNIASKSRFATMKDRYSFRIGKSIPNPELKSERTLNIELAGTFRISKVLKIRPEIYYSRLSNTIQPVSNVSGDLYQMQNTGNSVFSGTDISVNYTPVTELEFFTSYSYINRKNLSNPDILFINVPDHKLFASAGYTFARRLSIYVSAEYLSERVNTSDGSRVAPAYGIANINMSYLLTKHVKIETGINNIFDKFYMIEEGYPEPGRNFYASLYLGL
ncbi:MAG: TonB-dependent receptor [Chlorobi bacterium]|nr:TonB-dependent receptor [Chlorobiota bacterium]